MDLSFMRKVTDFLGGGKKWVIAGKTIYLWPIVAFAISVGLLVIYDLFLA